MRRADRLFEILQHLRRQGAPVTAETLAEDLEVSSRTIYRDMAALMAQGLPIEGEAGIGYVLRPGFDLPPLMFTPDEIEAIVLGAQLIRRTGDTGLDRAARDAVAKVEAVLPEGLRERLARTALYAPSFGASALADGGAIDLADVRRAIREARKLRIGYRDESGNDTDRIILPIAISFFTHVSLICAWCELRGDYRHFRTDRVVRLETLDTRFAGRSRALLAGWLETVEADCRDGE